MHVIIGEELYDREYIETYANGFEQLTEHVRRQDPRVGLSRAPASSRT